MLKAEFSDFPIIMMQPERCFRHSIGAFQPFHHGTETDAISEMLCSGISVDGENLDAQ
jgi:hypothetical protein